MDENKIICPRCKKTPILVESISSWKEKGWPIMLSCCHLFAGKDERDAEMTFKRFIKREQEILSFNMYSNHKSESRYRTGTDPI